jgi:hypothetical protein
MGDPVSRDPSERLVVRSGPVFLERANYRRRRVIDAVRLLPVLGALLWAVPLLWTPGETSSSAALLYIFGIWLGLVVLAVVLSVGLGRSGWSAEQTDPRMDEGSTLQGKPRSSGDGRGG